MNKKTIITTLLALVAITHRGSPCDLNCWTLTTTPSLTRRSDIKSW